MESILFKEGIPGFEEYKNYQIELSEDLENPFHKLQSLDEPGLSFIMIDPFLIKQDYHFNLTDSTLEKLEINEPKDIMVFTIITVPDEDYKNITTNLLAPIIINTTNKLAKQIVLTDTNYKTKHNIIESGE